MDEINESGIQHVVLAENSFSDINYGLNSSEILDIDEIFLSVKKNLFICKHNLDITKTDYERQRNKDILEKTTGVAKTMNDLFEKSDVKDKNP